MLLKDLPIPSGMDKSRILYLAQHRALKKSDKRHSGGERTLVAEASVGNVQGAAKNIQHNVAVLVPKTKKRVLKRSDATGKKKQNLEETGLHLRDEPTDDSEVEEIPPTHLREFRGIPTDLADVSGSGSGLPISEKVPSSEGVAGYTLIRFRAGRGWLGEETQGKSPLEALSAFSLSPDKIRLEKTEDEEVLEKAKEALGKVNPPPPNIFLLLCLTTCNFSFRYFVHLLV